MVCLVRLWLFPPNFGRLRFYITKCVALVQKTNPTVLNNLLMKILATKDVMEKEVTVY